MICSYNIKEKNHQTFNVMKPTKILFITTLITCAILFAPCFCNAQTIPQTEEITFVEPQTDTNAEEEINYLKNEITLLTVEIEELEKILEDLESKTIGMGEMSEMMTFELQMAMDRRSKFLSMLAQMMKKISSTQDTIIENMK